MPVRSFSFALLVAVSMPMLSALRAETTPSDPVAEPAEASDPAVEKAPPSTPGPLEQRLTITDVGVEANIDVGSGFDNPSSFWNGRPLRPIIFAPQSDGGAKIGWTDSDGNIHITPIDENARRRGDDTIIRTGLLRDLVAHGDGSAALVLQDGGMYLIRLQDGKPIFRIHLISNWCRDFHMGSLAWNGERYAAYFGVHGGGHEGDALRFVSPLGEILEGGWSWGCSHSIDMRVVTLGKRFMPLALSDAYPGTGIYFNYNKKLISYTWGDHSGATGARIGGMVALGERMFVAFSSKEGGRNHWSVALADFAQQAPYDQSIHKYLQPDQADQLNVKIARYGSDRLLVSWLEKGTWQRKFQRYDGQAKPIGAIEVLPVRASARADMRTYASGDVMWAHTWGEDKRTLKVMRIRYREDD